MKYKLKIIPQDGGYVGYALQNDEVVLTTNVHKDSVMASRELSKLIMDKEQITFVPSTKVFSSSQIPAAPQGIAQPSAPSAPTRRCCGRG